VEWYSIRWQLITTLVVSFCVCCCLCSLLRWQHDIMLQVLGALLWDMEQHRRLVHF